MSALPRPPDDLIRRVGWFLDHEDPLAVYDERGLEQWRLIKSLVGADWRFAGTRSLDFGCGAGRILRQAIGENPEGEYWGSDIDGPSIDWLQANLSPPAHVVQTAELPPLPAPDGHFDLAWAFSVFTHLDEQWSAWLAELHRVLRDDGILIATIFGPGHTSFGNVPVGEDVNGMNVLKPDFDWDHGGPFVLHSEWWIRAHWGRAFEIVSLSEGVPHGPPPLYGQSVVVLRKRPGAVTAEEFEAPEPGEPRELAAAQANVRSLRAEVLRLSADAKTYRESRSWKLTEPLRAVGDRLRPPRN